MRARAPPRFTTASLPRRAAAFDRVRSAKAGSASTTAWAQTQRGGRASALLLPFTAGAAGTAGAARKGARRERKGKERRHTTSTRCALPLPAQIGGS